MQITVAGEARKEFPPERAFVRINVGTELPDRGLAVQRATEVANRLRAHIDALGDAVVSVIQVGPTTNSWRGDPSMPTTHAANVTLVAEFVDFAALPRFLADAAAVPAATLSGVYWRLSDDSHAAKRDQVVAEAVQAAVRRARAMASAAGAGAPVLTELADAGLLPAVGGTARDSGGETLGAFGYAPMMSKAMIEEVNLAPAPVLIEEYVHARFLTTD